MVTILFFVHNVTFIHSVVTISNVYPKDFSINDLPSLYVSLHFSHSFLPYSFFSSSFIFYISFFHSLSFFPIHSHKFNSFILPDFLHFSFEFPSLNFFYYYFCHLFILLGFPYFPFVISLLSLYLAFFLSSFLSWTCVHLELSTSAESQKLAPIKEETCYYAAKQLNDAL